jgi:hypothetical protein
MFWLIIPLQASTLLSPVGALEVFVILKFSSPRGTMREIE